MLKAIIFDWGRTLYDPEADDFYPEVIGAVTALAGRFRLGIVSLVSGDYAARRAGREAAMRGSVLADVFTTVEFVAQDKDAAYERALAALGVGPTDVAIVDDRARRGVAWGARCGATTIWLRRGKFADEFPEHGVAPTYTVENLAALPDLLGA